MKAAIYTRFSSDLQRPASLEDQLRQCREEAARRGWTVTHTFADKEAAGTATERREGYQKMLKAARRREFGVLVVDELSRLTRDPEELAGLRKRLRFWGVHLRALGDGLDTVVAPAAAAPIMLMRSFANEIELEANAHRSRRGLAGRVLAGHHAGGAVYGYRTRPVHDDRPGDPAGTGQLIGYEYVIHEGEAEVIRRVFRLYAEGLSSRQIASILNRELISPPGARWANRRSRAARTWSHSAIHGDPKKGTGLLNQTKYIGIITWNRSTWPRDPEQDGKQVRREFPRAEWVTQEVPELRIVSQELWEAVKARQRERAREGIRSAEGRRHLRILSGLLVCGKCGTRYTLRGKNTYACSARQNRGKAVCDCMATVDAALAEEEILDALQAVLTTDRAMKILVARVQGRVAEERAKRRNHRDRADELRAEIATAEEEIQRLVEAIAQGTLVDALTARMRTAEARRAQLRAELAAHQPVPEVLQVLPAAVKRVAADLRQMLADKRIGRVKAALSLLVRGRIEVHEEPNPGHKRPHTNFLLQWDLGAVLRLAHGLKINNVGSPGGIRTRDLMAENHAS